VRNLGYRYASLSDREKPITGVNGSLRVVGYYVTTSNTYCLALDHLFLTPEWWLGLSPDWVLMDIASDGLAALNAHETGCDSHCYFFCFWSWIFTPAELTSAHCVTGTASTRRTPFLAHRP